MDAFQAALDELQRESKEQIAQAQAAASTAVLQGRVVPHRVAVAMAQRFTPDRVETSFPVLCLLDATLVRTTAAAAASPTPSEADQALAAVLDEFWTLAPTTAFVAVHEYGARQPAWREKCLRLVRRWKQRRLLPEPRMTHLLTAMEKGAASLETAGTPASPPPPSAPSAPSTHPSNATAAAPAVPSAAGASSVVSPRASTTTSTAPPPLPAFTAAQVRAFQATLQACMSALESLPPPRAALYVELVRAQHFRTPSRVACAFFDDLLKELRREVTMAATASTASTANTATAAGTAAAGAAAGAKDGASAASSGHAREALGKLLDQLHTSAADGGTAGAGAGAGGAASAAGPGAPHSAATVVVRYVSPIFSDIYAKQPLGQRGAGFGALQRKAGHAAGGGGGGGGGASAAFYATYYPKPEANLQRPFRIPPARQMHGGAVRLHFPRPQEWVAAQDMADLAQYMSRGGPERDRKRGRDGV